MAFHRPDSSSRAPTDADVAVIGGSGFYELLAGAHEITVDTPFGATSAPVTLGEIGGRAVAFIPRHGRHHELPPHKVPYRANLWALRQLGVTRVLSPCAVGSLRPEIAPGDFVVCDQLVDRTSGRADTYFDGPDVNHVSLADPFCPELRSHALAALAHEGCRAHDAGTVVVIQGPRFSTKAESGWYRAMGADLVNMTLYPEVALARELGVCYSAIALVTDYDSGIPGVDAIASVTMDAVFALLSSMVGTIRSVLGAAVAVIPAARSCGCGGVPIELPFGPVSR